MIDWSSTDIQAAFIQGGFTLVAGLFALGAGYLAYSAAITDVNLKKKEKEERKRAYRQRIKFIAQELKDELVSPFIYAKKLKSGQKFKIQIFPISIPEDFTSNNWEKLSLLSGVSETKIYILNERLSAAHAFFEEVSKNTFSYEDIPTNIMVKSEKKLADGGVELEFYTVGEQYQKTTEILLQSVNELLTEIEKEDKINGPA